MGELVEVGRRLRIDHDFRGYIHLKTIPDAAPELLSQAGRYADRLSVNVELPKPESLQKLAPEKNERTIKLAMGRLRTHIDETKDAQRVRPPTSLAKRTAVPRFTATGQSTQLIVGADDANDREIIDLAAHLYGSYRLSRIYYSAFSPIPDASRRLPLSAPPLRRESRLYQTDWLLRHYGFSVDELLPRQSPHLAMDIDPKLAWAFAHAEFFPLDINRAPREALLRVPGFGRRTVDRVLRARRFRAISADDLQRLGVPVAKVKPFIVLPDFRPHTDAIASLKSRLTTHAGPNGSQLELQV